MKAFAYYYICFFKSSFFEGLISLVVTTLMKNFLIILSFLIIRFLLNPQTMNVQIINKSKHATPSYETEGAAGMDIRANINESIILKTLERVVVKTGLFIALPVGYEAQVRPRSGLAAKKGITVLNSPGTIDADYRGEIGVILVNLSNEDFYIKDGERIAQLVIAKHARLTWEVVDVLEETKRGESGFGSTGV